MTKGVARLSRPKDVDTLTREWDEIALDRSDQLASGVDLSFTHILVPTALNLLASANTELVLDVGCGTGHFSRLLSGVAKQVVGIEPSRNCIEVARGVCSDVANVTFVNSTVEDAGPLLLPGARGTAAIALMVLMAAPHLERFANGLRTLLSPGASFVAVIPHPCFWPRYWGYENADWFSYSKELFIEAPFSISRSTLTISTTHIHRPLSLYLSTFADAGYSLDKVVEPMPSPAVESLYPAPWRFPRFLAAKWTVGI